MLQVLVFFRLPQGGKQLSFQGFILYLPRLCHATVNICHSLICSSFAQHTIVSEMLHSLWDICHNDVFSGEVQKGKHATAFSCLLILKSKGYLQCQTDSAN